MSRDLWILLLLACYAVALPTWGGLNSHSDFIGSLVPWTTPIQIMGPQLVMNSRYAVQHLTSHVPGESGNLTAMLLPNNPPLFAINKNQLWQITNETTIFPVAIKNTSHSERVPPLQLVLGKQPASAKIVTGGTWFWKGAMLRYELDIQGPNGGTNNGVFYTCPDEGRINGIYMFLTP